MTFDVRARFGPTNDVPRAGSDSEDVRALIRNSGYELPAEMMNVRLVHLLDEQKRKELMMIHAEDLQLTGVTAEALRVDGKNWIALEAELLERAQGKLDNLKIEGRTNSTK